MLGIFSNFSIPTSIHELIEKYIRDLKFNADALKQFILELDQLREALDKASAQSLDETELKQQEELQSPTERPIDIWLRLMNELGSSESNSMDMFKDLMTFLDMKRLGSFPVYDNESFQIAQALIRFFEAHHVTLYDQQAILDILDVGTVARAFGAGRVIPGLFKYFLFNLDLSIKQYQMCYGEPWHRHEELKKTWKIFLLMTL